MPTRITVKLPNGKKKKVLYKKGQSKMEIVEKQQLAKWQDYCNANWMSENHENPYASEYKVKRFLDRCAYLLLRDNPGDTLTDYREKSHSRREINVSSTPAAYQKLLYGAGSDLGDDSDWFELMLEDIDAKAPAPKPKKEPKQWPPTKFDKIERVKRELPGCTISTQPVDTENIFEHGGVEYQISDDVTQYQPRKTREGLFFDMDQVMVVEAEDGELRFYDQSFDRIADEDITIVEP